MKLLKSNLLYLSMLSFVLIASSALALASDFDRSIKEVNLIKSLGSTSNYPALPQLADSTTTYPVFSGQAVLALDLDSGVTLYEKNADAAVAPASTTKIITALVAMDYYNLKQELTISGISVEGQKMGLEEGEKITVKDLLYGLLVYSANDAAEALAKGYCSDVNCGREFFISAMNKKAYQLGLRNTNFVNPSGLDNATHYATAKDLVKASVEAMKNPLFAQIVATKTATVYSQDKKIVHKLANINELLGSVDGVLGIKTGWTENARENLVTYVERNGHRVVIALLGSQDRFGETTELIDWIFSNYTWTEVAYSYSP